MSANMFLQNTKTDKGYTLLFAVIVSSIVLSIAAFILAISRKQFILASAARDSTMAIYAADSGIQCYVKAYDNGYSTTSPFSVNCNNKPSLQTMSGNWASADSGASKLNFSALPVYQVKTSHMTINGSCVFLNIYDGYDLKTNSHKTVVESRGYSIGTAANCPVNNPREEERAIRLIRLD